MAPGRLAAALLVAGLAPALTPAAGAARTVEARVGTLRRGCLDHIPDLPGMQALNVTVGEAR